MKLKDVKEAVIKDLAGAAIFGRGRDYFARGMVKDLSYDPSSESILAKVAGTRLESCTRKSSYDDHLLASMYEMIGDEAAQLRTLQRRLEYGMDFWALAEFWLNKGTAEKAMETV